MPHADREVANAYQRAYRKRPAVLEKRCIALRLYRSKHPENVRRWSLSQRERHLPLKRFLSLKWHYENRDRSLSNHRKWSRENSAHVREYTKIRMTLNPTAKMGSRISRKIRYALDYYANKKKEMPTEHLTGCPIIALIQWIESQFENGMTWYNYGKFGWHIDHVKPCAAFDLSDIEQQKQCFHYTNLQPLWCKENLSKGAKWNGIRYRRNIRNYAPPAQKPTSPLSPSRWF